MKSKFYCYLDETRQDTEGKFFLVSVVVLNAGTKRSIETQLLKNERNSEKRNLKWNGCSFEARIAYLTGLSQLKKLYGCVFTGIVGIAKIIQN